MKRNYILSEKVTLKIKRPSDEFNINLDIFSHYTGINDDSGSGKTHFLEYIRAHRYDGVLQFEIPEGYELSFALDEATLVTALNQVNKQIIFVDEPNSCVMYNHIKQVNKCQHLMVLVSRGFLFHNAYPLNGMYSIREPEDLIFEISRMPEFPICEDICSSLQIVTEAQENKSENRLLKRLFPNVIALGSNGNIAKYIEEMNQDALIFCDLGNIGFNYESIMEAVSVCKFTVCFFDYVCYEQLLLASPIVSKREEFKIDPFSRMTLEKVFESMLKNITKDTEIAYHHKVCTYPEKLDTFALEDILDSKCGAILLQYLKKQECAEDNNFNESAELKKIKAF